MRYRELGIVYVNCSVRLGRSDGTRDLIALLRRPSDERTVLLRLNEQDDVAQVRRLILFVCE